MALTFETIHTDLQVEISQELRGVVGMEFAPRGTAKKLLLQPSKHTAFSVLEDFFSSLRLQTQELPELTNISSDNLMQNIEQRTETKRDLYTFLAILIYSQPSSEECLTAARIFTIEILAKDDTTWRHNICSLPISRDNNDLQNLFGQDTVSKFLEHQACLFPVVIGEDSLSSVIDPNKQRLPYLEQEVINPGGGKGAQVYKVRIAAGHFKNQEGYTYQNDLIIARKDYDEPMEHDVRQQIYSANMECQNIIKIRGMLNFGNNNHSLFMPLARCDLSHYLSSPKTNTEIRTMGESETILATMELVKGLKFLHEELTVGGDDKVCYHLDLKPKNILYFPDKFDGRQLKICDFGSARMHPRNNTPQYVAPRPRWMVRRNTRGAEEVQSTPNSVGQIGGTYLAPESQNKIPTMNEKSDVWSMGCIISVLLTYLVRDAAGVENYTKTREEGRRSDCFFDRDSGWDDDSIPHRMITKWHFGLIVDTRNRNSTKGDALEAILRFIENKIFLYNQAQRCTAELLRRELKKTHNAYKLQENRPEELSSQDASVTGGPESTRGKAILKPIRLFQGNEKLVPWSLKTTGDFKSCGSETSPSGSIIALWSQKKMYLYTSDVIHSSDHASSADFTINQPNCIFGENVSLSDKYLVASVIGSPFVSHCICYIFRLHNNNPPDRPSLPVKLDQLCPVTLPFPKIVKLAVSPKSKSILCIVQERYGSDQLLFIKMAVKEPGDRYQCLGKLPWSASQIDQLCFATDENFYLTICQNTPNAIISHFRLSATSRPSVLNLGSKGKSPITTFTPSHQTADTCTIVLKGKKLDIFSFKEAIPSHTAHTNIKNYRLFKIIGTSNDRELYALGMEDGRSRILLLEVPIPRNREEVRDEVRVKVIAELKNLWESGLKEVTLRVFSLPQDNTKHRIIIATKDKVYFKEI